MKDLWPYLRLMRRRLWWLLGGGALMLATMAASLGLIATAGWFITATGLAGAAITAGAAFTLDIYRPGAAIRFFAVFRTVSRYFERLTTHEATFRLLSDLRVRLFRRVMHLDHATLGRWRGGRTLNRLTGDIDALDHLYLRVAAPIGVAAAMLLFAFIGFAFVSPLIAAAGVGVLTLTAVTVPVVVGRLGDAPGRRIAQAKEDMRLLAVDGAQGLAELRAFAAAARHNAVLDAASGAHGEDKKRMARITGLASALTGLAGSLALWVAAVIGIWLISEGALSGPALALLVLGLLALSEAVVPLPLAAQYLGHTRAAAARLNALSESRAALPEPSHPAPLPERNDLALEDVDFRYVPHDRLILSNASLHIAQGERIALAGPSGIGKSTLASLFLRLYDPEAGRVTLGGRDLRSLLRDDIYRRIACLEQHPRLFNASIADNLWLADETAPPECLWAALEVAGLADFVEDLPEGLRTPIGEAGTLLSGGEARRLALARVVLTGNPVIILDEPTIGLDAATEAQVMKRLDPWLEDRTVLVITHAPERLFPVNRVLTLKNGTFRERRETKKKVSHRHE